MGLVEYVVAAVVTIFAAVYGVILFFRHQPRLPVESELKYITNDKTQKTYDLPERLSSRLKPCERTKELSVIIPCYNETKRLGKMMDECIEVLRKQYDQDDSKFEIIIVDDGSSDGTGAYALLLADELGLKPHTMKVVTLAKNRGKGGGVTHGLLYSNGKLSLFADADGATSFGDVSKLIDTFKLSQDDDDTIDIVNPMIAIGSRSHMVNTDAVVKRSFIRNLLMYGLHTLVYIFGIRDVKDTQCGFKMFNVESVRRIFPHMHTERWIFDVEVLLLGELQGIPVKEIAVNWQEIDGSKVDLARDSIEMAIDLVVTRLAYLLGVYKLDECGR
ncbi:dolichyl-phosphate beta-glucosyltransferase [Scheffersomyces spartinae]|uniref:dolichyl-phosphate beta-glucosyltransferase n=1 Tax=Scheffersomyces spartinae TaxID=45513 RepID=A0A9P8AIL2_9ASCO|nr:dolichyl-phosphate beta-glucosyltransferase [Scheffersomyces spartinae]KAG7193799.1 dolichyl-phosphate beta-glucosyltransferase [Scheffersomyces spartinae]